jgi:hypothetical protein
LNQPSLEPATRHFFNEIRRQMVYRGGCGLGLG